MGERERRERESPRGFVQLLVKLRKIFVCALAAQPRAPAAQKGALRPAPCLQRVVERPVLRVELHDHSGLVDQGGQQAGVKALGLAGEKVQAVCRARRAVWRVCAGRGQAQGGMQSLGAVSAHQRRQRRQRHQKQRLQREGAR